MSAFTRPVRDVEASQLHAYCTYRDELGNWHEVRSVLATRGHVIVSTNRGRYVMPKNAKVALV